MGEGGGTDRVWRWGRGEGLIESGDGGGGGTDRVWRPSFPSFFLPHLK